jgi:hypothetical protein
VYIYTNSGGSAYFSYDGASSQTSVMEVDEIMGALEPANDNGLPLSKVG